MATLFIGKLTLRSNLQRGLLVDGCIALAIFGNMLRSLLLSTMAHRHGVQSFDQIHDSTGWLILLFTAVGVGLIAFLANSLDQKASRQRAKFSGRDGIKGVPSPNAQPGLPKSHRSTGHKRTMDLMLTLLSAPFWVPLLLILVVVVRLKMGSPVLFFQDRPGLRGRVFRMYKFRTMTDARDAHGKLLPDAERLTAFGKWLRRTSMDELPELLNVIGGK